MSSSYCTPTQAAIEAEEEATRARKLKDRSEMERMLAANQDLYARRADRIAEELEVSRRTWRNSFIEGVQANGPPIL